MVEGSKPTDQNTSFTLHSPPSIILLTLNSEGQIEFTVHLVKKLEHFELKKDYAVFCLVGQTSFEEMADLISSAVLRCRQKKIKKLLIDSTGVSGLHPPGIAEGYDFVENISSHAKSTVKIAHVASPKWALNWLPAGQLPGHLNLVVSCPSDRAKA